MASPSAAFSEQVMLRLESALVSSGKVVVVDRANLDKIRAEQGFQLSGGVDDDSAKAIGKLLGAGAIVTGSTADMGDVYGLALKAINIETAADGKRRRGSRYTACGSDTSTADSPGKHGTSSSSRTSSC